MKKKAKANDKANGQSKQVFIENTNMETQTVFLSNGCINIFPCDFELGQHIVAGGRDRVSQKGRMVTDDDGTSHFRAYRKDSGTRYKPLLYTEHGEMKATRTDIKIGFSFKKSFTGEQVARALLSEVDDMVKWMKSRSTTINWK